MKLVDDFMNKLAGDLDKKYFPNLKYYRDEDKCANVHYACELYSNGCSTYSQLINKLAKNCKETKENIHAIVNKYVESFENYEYKV